MKTILRLFIGMALISGMSTAAFAQFEHRIPIRDPLSSDRTYFVRTDGSDSNSGLINSSAGAFLTIQRAVDVVADDLDLGRYNVVIQVGDGSYTDPVVLKRYLGDGVGTVTLRGNTTTPTNVQITTNGAVCIGSAYATPWTVEGFSLSVTGTAANCIQITEALVYLGRTEFRSSTGRHIQLYHGAINFFANINIVGGAVAHIVAEHLSLVTTMGGLSVTLTGTPSFSLNYIYASGNSTVVWTTTFSGSATGQRYNANTGAVINSFGGGASYLPGNIAGVAASGGIYN